MRISKEVARQFREVADRYSRETSQSEYEIGEVVDWGRRNGSLGISEKEQREILMLYMSEALRSDIVKTASGRKVRLRHCIEVLRNGEDRQPKQRVLWSHIDDARDEFLVESLRQRRRRIGADVEQLRADLEYINERRAERGLRPIQMTFNFEDNTDSTELSA